MDLFPGIDNNDGDKDSDTSVLEEEDIIHTLDPYWLDPTHLILCTLTSTTISIYILSTWTTLKFPTTT